jgi:hypothetical protein
VASSSAPPDPDDLDVPERGPHSKPVVAAVVLLDRN